MNEFSILCRVLGSLFYRQPQDPLLVPLFTLIREGKLAANWPLEQDDMLARLQKSCDITQISTDYNALFVGEECAVAPYRSAWVEGAEESEVRAFLTSRGMPLADSLPITLALYCSRPPGWKISLPKMKVKRWKPYLPIICFPGAIPSSVKLKPMPLRHSGALWRR